MQENTTPQAQQDISQRAEQAAERKSAAESTPALEQKANPGTYVHKFQKPFKYANTTYTSMNFYFDQLTGKDMLKIESEMQDNQEYAIAPEISRSFQCKMAALAAGNIGSDVLEGLPLYDFNKITTAARDFLLHTGS